MAITGQVFEFVSGVANHLANLPTAEAVIFDIGIILLVSAVLAFVAKILRQPLIPAYVLTGLLIGPLVFGFVRNFELITAFSEIGIAFLLFTAGLEISFRKIKEANLKKIALIGILQVLVIFGISFSLYYLLGLSALQTAYIGVIMAFGSTMVDIKLLSDSGELVTLHGRLVLGILLLQDLAAIIAIVFFTTKGFAAAPVMIAFAKLLGIILFAFILQKFMLNRFFGFAARSIEFLFLSSLAVLFLFIILAYMAEISIVIGAFIAGVSLANSPFKVELESRVSPLRDFFAILFFVSLGMQIVFTGISQMKGLLIALLVGAVIVKPIITFILLRATGYRPKTSFLTSISLAQLSEFSLIIGMLGVTLGALSPSVFSTVILATIITMSATPYFIKHKNALYQFFRWPVSWLRFFPVKEGLEYDGMNDKEVLLVGAHRMGSSLIKELMDKKERLLIIDYNPEIINSLIKNKISCIYGDVCSPEILNKIDMKKLKIVICTVPTYEENIHVLTMVKRVNKNAKVVVTGTRISEALSLYEAGADYVITPKVLAGDEVADIIHSLKPDLKKAKQRHLKRLREIHRLLY